MNSEEYKRRLEAEIEASDNHDYWSLAATGDAAIGAMRDRWLDPTEESEYRSEHHPDCPINNNRPWRPYKCRCKELAFAENEQGAKNYNYNEDQEDR